MPNELPVLVARLEGRVVALESKVVDLQETLRGSWDEMKLMLEKTITKHDTDNKERDAKIDALHNWKTWLAGGTAVIVMFCTAVGGIASAMVINELQGLKAEVTHSNPRQPMPTMVKP